MIKNRLISDACSNDTIKTVYSQIEYNEACLISRLGCNPHAL